MPRSRTYRRRYSRRSRYGLSKMKVYQSPATSFRKLSYDAQKMISPGINQYFVPNTHFMFRANGIYDPDVAQGGEVAVGYQSAALGFNHYTVYASKIIVKWVPYSQSANSFIVGAANEGSAIPIWVGVGLVPDATAITQNYKHLSQDSMWNWDYIHIQAASWGTATQPASGYIQKK